LNNRAFPGTVARFSEDVSADTRTMHTEVNVPNPQHVLIPGMYAQATIVLEKKNNVLTVPLQALTQSGDRSTVDVVDADNKIQIATVQVGIESATDAEIDSGLRDNAEVVTGDRSGL